MTRTAIVLVLLSAATLAAARQEVPLGGPPRLEIDSRQVDFGTLERGAEAVAEIELRNTGGRPLEIVEIVSGCGCTIVEAPARIPRGGSGTLRLTVDTTGLDEKFRSGVTLTTNDPKNTLVHIGIDARLLIGIELLPTTSLRMRAGRGLDGSAGLVVRRLPGVEGVLAIDNVSTDRPWLAASARRVEAPAPPADGSPELRPGDWIVEARLTGAPISGATEASVRFDTGLDREPRGGFPVRVLVPRPINVEPAELILRPAPGGAVVSGELLAAVRRDLAEWPLTAAVDEPGFSAKVAQAGSRYYRITISWDPARPGAVPAGKVTLDVSGQTVTVPVRVGED